jgi:hypothetical protein
VRTPLHAFIALAVLGVTGLVGSLTSLRSPPKLWPQKEKETQPSASHIHPSRTVYPAISGFRSAGAQPAGFSARLSR